MYIYMICTCILIFFNWKIFGHFHNNKNGKITIFYEAAVKPVFKGHDDDRTI